MPPRTYDQDPNTLPPWTKGIIQANYVAAGLDGRVGPIPYVKSLNAMLEAMLDAIHALENRVIDLEAP